jgi:hypothetical protein
VSVEFAALDNYPSALFLQPQLEAYLQEDVALGHLAKVHVSQVASPLRVHPIALVPKPGQPGKFRLITDISSPSGSSINDLVPPPPPFKMVSVRNLFNRIRRLMWGGKVDVAHAFRNIPLARLFAGHLAFRVGDYYYFELRLPFGFTWSPFVWNSFSDFIQRYCAAQGVNCVVYCDDFLVLAENKKDCLRDMSFLLEILRLLGVPVKPSKIIWPTQKIEFLGLVLDFVNMTVSASPERVASIVLLLEDMLSRKSVPFRSLEKLVGKLSFVAQIISGGRTFLRRLFDAYPRSRRGKITITNSMRADLKWWHQFLPIWNGLMKMRPDAGRRRFAFTSDASNAACGGASQDCAIVRPWAPSQASWHINVKELWSVYHCLRLWSPKFLGATVVVGCDNQVVVSWLNNGCARSPLAMKILRKIFWICAKFDVRLFASWIPTDVNSVSDAASRLDFPGLLRATGFSLVSPSRADPLSSILSSPSGYLANCSEFRNLLRLLKTSSLPKQERSYWPLMHDPHNVLESPHGKYLFGFALPMDTTPESLLRSSSFALPRSCSREDTPSPRSSPTSPPSLPSMPPWVFRLVSRDWNAPRFSFYDKAYVDSLLRLEVPGKDFPFPSCGISGNLSTFPTGESWLSGLRSPWDSFPSSELPISFPNWREAVTEFYTYDAPMSNSRMVARSSKSDVRKLISSESGKSVFRFLKFRETRFAPCLPSAPSSALSNVSRLCPPFPTDLFSGSTTPTF